MTKNYPVLSIFLLFIFSLMGIQHSLGQCTATSGENVIGGRVFQDVNSNGVLDGGETGTNGITVYLFEDFDDDGTADGPAIQTGSTDASGDYTFTVNLNYTQQVSYSGSITQSSDDAREKDNDDVEINKNEIAFKDDGNNVWNGLRFNDISIPSNAIIDSAFVYFTSKSDKNNVPASVKIYGQDNVASPATFSEVDRNLSSRAKTAATVNWIFGDWVKDTVYRTPDIANIISEIHTDQNGLSDESIALLIQTGFDCEERVAYSWDDEPTDAPDLVIYYSVPLGPFKYLVSTSLATYPMGASPTTGNQKVVSFSADGTEDCDNHFGYFTCSPNCPPGAADDNSSGESGIAQVIGVLANDTDADGNLDPSSLTVLTQPANGSASVLNGAVVYIPNGTYSGYDSFTYQVCDNTNPTPLCATAVVNIAVGFSFVDVCNDASQQHIFYLPYPSEEAYDALEASADDPLPSNNLSSIISLKIPYEATIIFWDEWEDGYEANVLDPQRVSTKIWGDGKLSNGVAPGYPTDIIPAGGSIVLNDTMMANPRNPVDVFFDGKDKIVSSNQINVTQVCGEPANMGVQSMKTPVRPIFDFGESFTIPVGEDFNSDDFKYTAFYVCASENNTTVNIDKDNDFVFETTIVLNEGQVYFEDGGVLTGATVISSAPVSVEFHSGGVDGFSVRNAPIFPATWYSHTYYTPVPTSDNSGDSPKDSSVVMLYNSLNRSIDIDWSSGIPSSGTITLPAKSVVRFPLAYSTTAAYKFVNPTEESFVALEIVDSYTPGGGGNGGETYDWSFNLISEERLTDYATLAWAPGGLDLAPPVGPDVNGNPIWVTPNVNTSIYVKYDGDLSSGGAVSPCGFHYDVTYPLNALNYLQVRDPSDNDQSGLAVYTCDGAKIAVVYGEDPKGSTTGFGDPHWDVGLTVQPSCASTLIFANEDFETTPVNVPVLIGVLDNDGSFLVTIDDNSVSNVGLLAPSNGTIVIENDGNITYTPNLNFQGTDYFEYRICAIEDAGKCDVTTVTVKVVDCNASPDNVLINGYVYLELNPDNGEYDGEDLVAGITIDLYEDKNGDAILDPGDDFIQTEISKPSGAFTFTIDKLGDYIVVIDTSALHYTGAIMDRKAVTFVVKQNCENNVYLGIKAVMEAVNDVSSGVVDQTQLIAVLSNDIGFPDPISVDTTGLQPPANGSLVLNPDGTISYIPNPSFQGADWFEYRVCSSQDPNLCDTARVDITVSCYGTPGQNDVYGLVFNDENNNGIQDIGEIGTSGIDVNIFENNPPLATRGPEDVLVTSGTTDAFGNYTISQTLTYLVTGTPYSQMTLSEDDDAREKGNGDVETDQDLKITKTDDNRWNGLRFTGITIPTGSNITNAYVRFTSMSDKINPSPSVRFYGQDGTASPATFVDGSIGTLRGRSRTSNTVDWTNVSGWTTDNKYDTPDLSSIIQEIIDDQSGLTNGAIVLITEAVGDNEERKAYDFGADNTKSPQLVIEFEYPVGPHNFIMEVVTSSLPPSNASMTTDNVETSTFAADGTSDCSNNFGYFIPDIDEDDDGITDLIESSNNDPEADEDGDGTPNWQDVVDNGTGDGSPTSYVDGDGNGLPDVYDADGDGVPNFLDLDSDNDGIADIVEAGGEDTDGDGHVDARTAGELDNDTDGDGLDDLYDDDNGGTAISNPDTDNDGIKNTWDLDADGDGMLDVLESGGADADRDGIADSFVDTDEDGFNDTVDGDVGDDGTAENASNAQILTGADTDNDGVPDSYPTDDFDGDLVLDFLDVDSDNDGIFDLYESQETLGYTPPTGTDTDGDGIDNAFDDDDANFGGAGAAGTVPVDTDGTELADYIDTDADGDGLPDIQEAWDALNDGDTDPDGVTGSCTTDNDGDGLVDCFDSNDNDPLVWTIGITPPDDDGTNGSTTSVGVDILASNDADDIFPNNGLGSDVNQPDWRDVGTTTSVGNYIWLDDDKDGIQDNDEFGISGVTVSLLDGSGNLVAATKTDAFGNYSFGALSPGDYAISVTPLPNYTFATADAGGNDTLDSDINSLTGKSGTFSLAAGDTNLIMDAGFVFATKSTASIGNYVWLDIDSDDTQSGSDLGFAGVTVTLYDNAGNIVATTISSPSGAYLFSGLAPGSYRIGATLPYGYGFVAQTIGNATGSDIDPTTKKSPLVVLSAGEENGDLDIGLEPLPATTANVGGNVWNDLNQNGIQDAGEPGVAGSKVILYGTDGTTIVDSTWSDAFGEYRFTGLTPGKFHASFTAPSGYTFTSQYQGGNVATDSDVYPSGLTDIFVIFPDERNTDIDAGVYQTAPAGTARIGDRVWYDYDNDGIQDAGEPGVPGASVILYDNADIEMGRAVTDPSGKYVFTDLAAGNYYIRLQNYPIGYGIAPRFQGGDITLDSDVDYAGKSQTIALASGQNYADLDAGIIPMGSYVGVAAMGGRAWNDTDADGIRDAGELGVAGVQVTLYEEDGTTVIATTETNATGQYYFMDVSEGNYVVGFTSASFPTNYVLSAKDQGSNDFLDSDANTVSGKTDVIVLGIGQELTDNDAGLNNPTVGISSIGDRVWNDRDGDGILDAGENGFPGISVTLYDAFGAALAVTQTDDNGLYRFYSLAAGDYQIGFSNLPAGFGFSPQDAGGNEALDSDVHTATGRSVIFSLSSSTDFEDLDAGITATSAMLGDYVWFDQDGDGLQDASENGITGVKVTLYDVSDNKVAVAITDKNGAYLFPNLDAGTYSLGFENLPDGTSFSPQDNTGDDTNDSDVNPSTGKISGIILSATDADLDADAGVQPQPKTGLGDYIWFDADTDGVQDAGEIGLPGVRVTLYDNGSNPQSVTVTNGAGFYQFDDLEPGTYHIGLSKLPVNSLVTPKDAGAATEATDSDIDTGTKLSDPVVLATGVFNADLDGGIQLTGAIGGLVWYDAVRDGLLSYTELMATGVTIELLASDSSTVVATTNSGGYFGSYFFMNIPAGDYYLRFKDLPATYGFTIPNAGSNDRIDSDAIPGPTHSTLNIGTTFKVTIGAGQASMITYAGLNATPFAVEWLSFSAEHQGEDGLLHWVVATEENADYYGIERSIDGNFFMELGKEIANNISTQESEYTYLDKNINQLPVDRLYYRLRQVDLDGTFTYSNVVELELGNDQQDIWASVSPIPATDQITIAFKVFVPQSTEIDVINAVGKKLFAQTFQDKSGKITVPVSQWPSGFYYVRFMGENSKKVFKVQVTH